jgi:Transposase
MKKRYAEERIIGFLRDRETGIGVKDLCRKHGFSEASLLAVEIRVWWDVSVGRQAAEGA